MIANSVATLSTLRLGLRTRRRLFAQAIGSPSALPGAVVERDPSDPESLVIGIVGRLSPWKGQDVFLRAFTEAFPDGGVVARVVGASLFGEGEFEAELRRLADELGIAERVEFVGHTDDVGREFARFDVAVHASVVPEPFGQVVVEAMAAGCAVVATDGGGPAEVITDGVDGVLVPMGDVRAMAEVLRVLAGDRGLRTRLGEAASLGARRFAPDRVAVDVETVYRLVGAVRRLTMGHRFSGRRTVAVSR